MVNKFSTYDAPQVAFILELAEDGGRGTPHGILEIDGIGQVDGQCNSIDS